MWFLSAAFAPAITESIFELIDKGLMNLFSILISGCFLATFANSFTLYGDPIPAPQAFQILFDFDQHHLITDLEFENPVPQSTSVAVTNLLISHDYIHNIFILGAILGWERRVTPENEKELKPKIEKFIDLLMKCNIAARLEIERRAGRSVDIVPPPQDFLVAEANVPAAQVAEGLAVQVVDVFESLIMGLGGPWDLTVGSSAFDIDQMPGLAEFFEIILTQLWNGTLGIEAEPSST